jgi:dTDP-glucose 4,6-dehydratase
LNPDPLSLLDITVRGAWRVLEFARQAGVRKLLLTSSGAVYGRQPPELGHTAEDYPGAPDPMLPQSAYGQGKRLAEHLCAVYAEEFGLECKIARCFAFVGPYLPLDAHYAVGNFLRDGLAGGPIVVRGDGTPCRSYLYAADLAAWLWTILLRGASGRAYNVGSEAALTIAELARLVAAAFPRPPEVQICREPLAGAPAERYVPSTRRAAVELGLNALVALPQGIARTLAWHGRAGGTPT